MPPVQAQAGKKALLVILGVIGVILAVAFIGLRAYLTIDVV